MTGKKFNLFKNNASWLFSLKWITFLSTVLFLLALIIFVLDIVYTSKFDINSNNGTGVDNISFRFDVIIFPISVVLSFLQVVICTYFIFNIPSWIVSAKKGMKNRKIFNLIYVISSLIIVTGLFSDSLIRFFFVLAHFNNYLNANDSGPAISAIDFKTDTIFGKFYNDKYKYGNFGFNTIILLLLSFSYAVLSFVWEWIQKIKYKSEQNENSRDDVQNYYRNLEKSKLKKDINKQKQKDFKKKITTF